MSSTSNPLLEAKGITKYFGTITALENVNLKVHAGECLGVVGDNGAGKSTLMKVLSGLYKPSAGSLFFQGKEEILESPRDSQNLGLEMVYQDLALAGNLPIGENIFLGREPTKNLGFLKLLDFNKIKELTKIANRRGQSLPQMALSWVLRQPTMTSALIGARTVNQLNECLDSLNNLKFTKSELKQIDKFAKDEKINLWEPSSRY